MRPLDIKALLFGDESLENLPAISKAPGDLALVRKLSVSLGQSIKETDPAEELYHVEFVSYADQQWAEVWAIRDWKESNSRRLRVKSLSHEENQELLITRERIAILKQKIPKAFGPAYQELLASQMLANWKQQNCTAILRLIGVAEDLAKFEEEDKQ